MPTRTQEFANVYHGRLPTYGFLPEGVSRRGAPGVARTAGGARIHGCGCCRGKALPEQSAWERDLRSSEFLLQDTRMAEPDGQRLALYDVCRGSSRWKRPGIGTIFGDPALVDEGINAGERLDPAAGICDDAGDPPWAGTAASAALGEFAAGGL